MSDEVLSKDESTIGVIRIPNPFQPHERIYETYDWQPNKTVSDYVEHGKDAFVALNGELITSEKEALIRLSPGDNLIISNIPRGGGNNGDKKSVLRLVALVIITVASAGVGGAVAAAGYGATAAAIAQAAVVIIGTMVVNSLLPVPDPTIDGGDGLSDSPSYGIDGPKNVSTSGIAVPICYGEHRMAGNAIGLHIENDGGKQYLYMLLNAGEGTIAGIQDLRISDQPIENYSDTQYVYRIGTDNQPIIPWFHDTIVPNNLAFGITDSFTTYTAISDLNQIRFDVVFPSGLFQVDAQNGKTLSVTVQFEFEYRVVGSGTWLPLPVTDIWQGINVTEVYPPGYVIDGTEYYDGDLIRISTDEIVGFLSRDPSYGTSPTVTSGARTPVRRSFLSQDLPYDTYEFRYRRTTPEQTGNDLIIDAAVLTDANEIVRQDINYNYTALVALKLLVSDQISNIPNVTYLNLGKVIRVWEVDKFVERASSNPAWIALDAITNTRYGGGVPDSKIDMVAFKDWAQHCDDNSLKFNGVMDADSNLWDSLKHVFRAGHAQILRVGTKYSVAIERADSPVMMFSVANMVKDTFSINWLPLEERANAVEVTYYDKDDNYKAQTIKVYDQQAYDKGLEQRVASISLPGITDVDTAYKEARLILNMNRYILQTVSFDVPIESIACTVGSQVYVQHDMPQWGYAGRLVAGSTNQVLELDRPVDMEEGKSYMVLVNVDSVSISTGTVSLVAGNFIYLSGYDGVTDVKRLVINGNDLEVLSIVSDGNGNGVEVSDSTGISIGNSYELFDTDVIEEVGVVNFATGTMAFTQLTLQSTLSAAPAQFSKWMFGENTKVKKPFRVVSISGSDDFVRTIGAVEYNEDVYNNTGDIIQAPNYSDLDLVIEHVSIDGVAEKLVKIGNVVKTNVTVSWTPNYSNNYYGADIHLSVNNLPFEKVGEVRGGSTVNSYTVDHLEDDDHVAFKIVAYDSVGKRASYATAPEVNHTVVGKSEPPADVVGFTGTALETGILLEWNPVPDIDLSHYKIVQGETYQSGVVVDEIKATRFLWKYQTVGTYQFWIVAVDNSQSKNESLNPATTSVNVTAPTLPITGNSFAGETVVLEWSPPSSVFPIDRYVIKYGTDYQSGTYVTEISGTRYTLRPDWSGTRKFWIGAVDAAGNLGATASIDVTIVAPSAVTISQEVVDNNVLLRWSSASGTLPVKFYEIRKGDVFASAEVVGVTQGTFNVLFETSSGDYRYWVVAIDSAGNYGTENSLVATVSQPPDYILRQNWDGDASSGLTNGLLNADGYVTFCVDTAETWTQHFQNNSWNTPQDQVTAGYNYYIQPSQMTGSWVKEYDYGAVLPGTLISLTTDFINIVGNVTVTPTISVRETTGDAWTDYPGVYQVFSGTFRYVKITLNFSATADTDFCKIKYSLKLSIKQKTDSGSGTAASGDSGGTTTTFNVGFIDVESIQVAPQGTTSVTAVVNFVDAPNPTDFKVLLFDESGTRVSGSYSWTARGY